MVMENNAVYKPQTVIYSINLYHILSNHHQQEPT